MKNYDFMSSELNEGLRLVRKNNKSGCIDKEGTEVIPCVYDKIYKFENGLAKVKKDNNWGIIDTKNNIIVPIEYKNVSFHKKYNCREVTLFDDSIRFIDDNGNSIIDEDYEIIEVIGERFIRIKRALANYFIDLQYPKNKLLISTPIIGNYLGLAKSFAYVLPYKNTYIINIGKFIGLLEELKTEVNNCYSEYYKFISVLLTNKIIRKKIGKVDASDIIIDSEKVDFPIGWTPNRNQNMYVKCPNCGHLFKFVLGQGEIIDNKKKRTGICPYCNEYAGDNFYTQGLFSVRNLCYLYTRKRYLLNENDMNNQTILKEVSKQIGESYFEEIENVYSINRLKDILEADDKYYMINKNDKNMILYLSFVNAKLDKFYTIDDDLKVTKLKEIKLNINLLEENCYE